MPTQTKVLVCNPTTISFTSSEGDPSFSDSQTHEALRHAAKLLRDQQCVAFPTETVYGLGALALDTTAASRIFSTKGRPPDNPLIVHVASQAMLRRLLPPSYIYSRTYEILMKHFWPGPLTLLFPTEGTIVPSIITAGQPTVAVRIPSHPVARALIAICDAPIAAPSANSSGKPSPTRAEHVSRDLEGKLGLILDGGPCDVGLESTVVDGLHEDGNIRVLRPGGITVEDIERVLREDWDQPSPQPAVLVHRRDYRDDAIEQAPTTPGMKYRHYSPAVPVILVHTSSIPPSETQPISVSSLFQFIGDRFMKSGGIRVGVLVPSNSRFLDTLIDIPDISWDRFLLGPLEDPSITAQRLFDGFLTLEQAGVDIILIEEISEEREGLAVMNRVRKAAAESVWLEAYAT